eukprot:gb/GFBE01013169.1/.p1 GENE.gb/GFBE01013169.1/~~gb/GFBE01013169.1/.p1  ORF type:complete len:805 (+),score=199.67 gb/GFBE01013169.1/:1-2415(+)
MLSDDEDGGGRGLGSRKKGRDRDDSDDDLGGVGLGFGGGGGGLGFGRKKRKGGGNDENLFGVFADGGDDERGRRDRNKKVVAKTVMFVKGTTMQPMDIPAAKADDNDKDDSEDDGVDKRFKLDGAPNAPNVAPTVEGPKLPAKNKLSFNQMAVNYGKGFAMMQKMGFTGGGLGKHNDGIANPIEVQKRVGKMGVQDEGERVDQDLYGTDVAPKRTVEELLSIGQRPKKKDDGPKLSESWKRGEKEKKPKTIYKTAAELASESPGMRIVDMRGPEVKVASSFSELAANLSGDSVKSLKELRHNTRLLVAKYEDKIRSAAERKRHFENVLLSVAKEQERLQAAESITESDLKTCKELVVEIESLREKQDEGTISLKELADAFKRLRSTRPKEFDALRAMDVAFALALPTAKRELSLWRPLQKPDDGFAAMAPWQKLAEGDSPKRGKKASPSVQLTALLESSLLPRLRHALGSWSPRDCEPCLRLMERCRAQLPLDAAESIIAEVVLPRLRAEIESWDPRVDKTSAHLWLHPWLPILGARMDVLWAPVRFKISSCLDRWDPADHSAHGLLKPWEKVFDASNWDPLIEKILVRLEKALADMPIKPDGQDLQPMKDLILWVGLAPLSGIARVLESAFFPQWHDALTRWLRSPGCNFQEVLQWYSGWKALFPAELREQASVQRQVAHGLEVMKHVMANGSASELPEAPRAATAPAAAPEREAPRRPTLPVEEVSLSLSDYLSEVAAEEGLIFAPKKTQRNGKPIYQLGNATVQLDKNLVYAAPKSGDGEWKAVSMDEVLALAREASAKKR